MLEPERRHLLLDALRPPAGFVFDQAVGTTFTLDLVALLVTPVAFALFDVEADDGRALANPIAVLEAVRRHAGRITVFSQAGQVKVPAGFRASYAYLEEAVVPVRAPRAGGIFHPKVWVIRFVAPDGERRYRFLCLSRNLTFDRSWDTVLRLDGRPTDEVRDVSAPLGAFLEHLPAMTVGSLSPSRRAAIDALATEVATVDWEPLPDGLQLQGLWPLGHDPVDRWPFPDHGWRRLVVSPFVGEDFLARFTRPGGDDYLVTRPETLDALGAAALKSFRRRCVLASDTDAASPEADQDSGDLAAGDEAISTELRGLHAKLFVVDDAWWSRIWTGSANATTQAFTKNVEFLVELRGRNTLHGTEPLTKAVPGPNVGFGRLLVDYEPAAEPVPEDASEKAARELDNLAMRIGGLRFEANATLLSDDRYRLTLVGAPSDAEERLHGIGGVRIACRPVSLGSASMIEPRWTGYGLTAEWIVSFGALTAFFVVELESEGPAAAATSFLVRADLSGAPDDRLERVLVSELRSRSDLVRLLLLLLGGLDPAFGDLVDIITNEHLPSASTIRDPILGSEALLEPLMRTLARDPDRLDEIERLVDELTRTEEGRGLLPEGWPALWSAVREARPRAGLSA